MSTLTIIEDFGGKPIEFSRGDAFVNLTSMCAAFGKKPYDFTRLPSTEAFLDALAADIGALRENLVTVRQGGTVQGTWAHPDLALECARWLSPAFAIWCNRAIRKILADAPVAAPALPATYKDALKALVAEIEAKEALALENADMRPKAEFFDAVTASDDTLGMNESAKLLNIGRNKMMAELRKLSVLRRNNTPYQEFIDAGYFKVVESKWADGKGDSHVTLSTRVFQRGIEFIRKKLTK